MRRRMLINIYNRVSVMILKKFFKKLSKENGMSLVEVVVMLVVLGLSIGPLSKLAINNLSSAATAAAQTKAVFYAQGIMENIIADYRSNDPTIGGFDNVIVNWRGVTTPSPPSGLSGSVAISNVDSLMGVAYVTVDVNVGGPDVNVDLSAILSN